MAGKNSLAEWQTWTQGTRGRLTVAVRARPQAVAWAVVAMCLGAWIGWECLRPLESAGLEGAAVVRNRPPSLPQAAAVAPESLNALQQRVLFKARNQAASNASVQATAQELLKKLQLRGISRQGPEPTAYVQAKGEAVKRVAAGDKVAEFSVVQVDATSVRLELGGEQVVLGF
jgi:hypothetical protein